MNTNYNIYKFPLVLVFSLTSAAFCPMMAQETADSTMNQSVRLARDYSPVVQQKNKIDRQPAQQEIKQSKSDASYIDWKVDAVKSSEIGVVPAGEVITTDSEEQMGYIELSAGNYWDTDLKAEYKIDDFTIDAKGFFTQSQLKLPHPVYFAPQDSLGNKKWHNRLLNGDIMGTYSVTLDNNAQFEAHLGAAGTSAKMFNYQFFGLSTDTLQMVTDKPGKQSWGRILGDASYEDDNFKLKLGYEFNKLSVSDSLPCDWRTNTLMLSGTYGIYDHDNWQAALDLDLGGVFGKEKSYFIAHPTLHLSLIPNELEWRRFFVDLGFGTRRESLYELMNRMPVGYMEEEYKLSTDCFDLRLGYEDNNQGYLRWGTEVELKYIKNELCAEAVAVDTTSRDGMYMRITQDNCFAFSAGAHLDYEYNRYFGAKANLHFHSHSCKAAGMGEPHFEMGLHALSNPGRVKMDLGLDLQCKREMQYMGQSYDLGSLADVNFRIDWQCSDNLRLFAFGRNLLNQEYELWPGIPAQGINVHAGFKWDF